MSALTREDVVGLIDFYEARGWDWRMAVEFTIRKASGSLPWQEQRPRSRVKTRITKAP